MTTRAPLPQPHQRPHQDLIELADAIVADWPDLTQDQIGRLRALFEPATRPDSEAA